MTRRTCGTENVREGQTPVEPLFPRLTEPQIGEIVTAVNKIIAYALRR